MGSALSDDSRYKSRDFVDNLSMDLQVEDHEGGLHSEKHLKILYKLLQNLSTIGSLLQ
jgi:hypothetical protein